MAIKVQYPGVAESVEADMRVLVTISGRGSSSTIPGGRDSSTGSIVTASSGPGTGPTSLGVLGEMRIPIEVELAPKSKPRLDAILKLHLAWIIARKTNGIVYVCGDEEGSRRIERAGERVGLYLSHQYLRIELLNTIRRRPSRPSRRPGRQSSRRLRNGLDAPSEFEGLTQMVLFAAVRSQLGQ